MLKQYDEERVQSVVEFRSCMILKGDASPYPVIFILFTFIDTFVCELGKVLELGHKLRMCLTFPKFSAMNSVRLLQQVLKKQYFQISIVSSFW